MRCADGLLNYTVEAAELRDAVGKKCKVPKTLPIVGLSMGLFVLLHFERMFFFGSFYVHSWLLTNRTLGNQSVKCLIVRDVRNKLSSKMKDN